MLYSCFGGWSCLACHCTTLEWDDIIFMDSIRVTSCRSTQCCQRLLYGLNGRLLYGLNGRLLYGLNGRFLHATDSTAVEPFRMTQRSRPSHGQVLYDRNLLQSHLSERINGRSETPRRLSCGRRSRNYILLRRSRAGETHNVDAMDEQPLCRHPDVDARNSACAPCVSIYSTRSKYVISIDVATSTFSVAPSRMCTQANLCTS